MFNQIVKDERSSDMETVRSNRLKVSQSGVAASCALELPGFDATAQQVAAASRPDAGSFEEGL
jgi:hypothetical protein